MTEQEQVQLLPCPFCGGEAFLDSCQWCECCGKAYNGRITCRGCWQEVSHLATDAEAIAAWNTRHTATAEALEAMREAREALERIALICSNYGEPTLCDDCHDARQVCRVALPRLTSAIAKIEGQQP